MHPLKIILTIIPFIWLVGCLPFANRVHPIIMGLPFLAFWISAGVVVCFFCTLAMYHIDRKNDTE
ncbi:MAG: DUF3311 domain-containing protein [Sporomusaceae bacterium]|jgi:hypothetical protein|nr:DUF3311 domain-containing protein [Sporomusaceae bacterium]